jgi:hypothetical protein
VLILAKNGHAMESSNPPFYYPTTELKNPQSLVDICFPYFKKEAVAAIKQKDYEAIEATLGRVPYEFAEKLFEEDEFSHSFTTLLELYYFTIIKFNNKITFPDYRRTPQCPAIIYNIFNRVSLKALQFMDSRALAYNYPFSPIPSHITDYFRENPRGLFLQDGWITWELIKLFTQVPRLKVKKLTIHLIDYWQVNQRYENSLAIARKDPNYRTVHPEMTPWAELDADLHCFRRDVIGYRLQSLLEQMPHLEYLIFYDPVPAFDYSKVLLALSKMTKIQYIALRGYGVRSTDFPNIKALCQEKGLKLTI